jgi:hypothetical protein
MAQKQPQSRRRHPVDARRLAQGRRSNLSKFLPGLMRQSRYVCIIQIPRQPEPFVAPERLDVGALTLNVTGIDGVRLELLERERAPPPPVVATGAAALQARSRDR